MSGRPADAIGLGMVGRVVVALGAGAMLVASLWTPVSMSAGEAWTIYRHPHPPFTIVHPADWNVVREQQGVPFGAHVVIGEKRTANGDTWPLHVLVRSLPLPPGMTSKSVERDWWAYVRSPKPGYQHLRLDRTDIDGRPALIGYSIQPAAGSERSSYVIELLVIALERIYVVDARVSATSRELMSDIARLRQIMMTFRAL